LSPGHGVRLASKSAAMTDRFDENNLCPVCRQGCGGQFSKRRTRVHCLRKPLPESSGLDLWHVVNDSCRCGEKHRVD
jgi:hypothetical protein